MPVEHAHVLAVSALPLLHRDPFDRLLICQAASLDAIFVTAEELLVRYPGRILLAGT